MKRKMILLLIGLGVLGAAIFFYIDTVFLPIQLKQFLIAKAQKYLHRQVAIEAIDFKPIQGFIFDNIVVSQKEDPQKPFIQVKQVTFNLLLAPFFQKKAIIIPNIRIKDPWIAIARDKKGNWNFSDLINIYKTRARKNIPAVLLRKFYLENGTLEYADKSLKEEFAQSIQGIDLDTTLSLNKGIRFIGKAQIPELKSVVRIKGNHSLIERKLTTQILLDNIHLARYLALINPSKPYVDLSDGMISSADIRMSYQNNELQAQGAFVATQTDIHIGETKKVSGTIRVSDMLLTWRGQKWDAKGRIEIPSAVLSADSGRTFQGDIVADLNLLTIFGENITSQGNVTVDNAHLKIDEQKSLSGHIKATNASLSNMNDTIRLQGDIHVGKTAIILDEQTSIKGNLSTTGTKLTWSSPDKKGNRKLDVQSGLKMDATQITFGKDRSINGVISAPKATLVVDKKIVTVDTQGQINKASIHLDSEQTFQGDPHFNIAYQYDPKRSASHDYTGSLHFAKGQLAGIPTLENIDAIEGIVTFTPKSMQTERLTFRTQDTDFLLSGLMEDFAKPKLNIEASSSNIQIQKVLTLFPALRENIKADIIGQIDMETTYKGPAYNPSEAMIEATAKLSDTTIAHESLPDDIVDVFGQLEFEKDLLTWRGLNATYNDRLYILNGQMADFSRPTVDTKVMSDSFNLTTQIKLLNQAFQLTLLTGNYLNSSFDLKGDIHLFNEASPDIDLRGKVELNLEDISTLIPRLKNKAQQMKPAGIVAGEGIFQGKFDDWRNWKLSFDGTSDRAMIRGYPFEDVAIRFEQRDKNVSQFDIASVIYGGELKIDSSADLRDEESSFASTMSVDHLDLKLLRKDQNLKNRHLAGNLSMTVNINGPLNQWRQMTGDGSLHVTEGRLWKWDILEGISGILLIPEFQTLVFTEAHSNFTIQDLKFYTENAQVIGKTATLDAKGWIDFQKNLDFDITPTFSEIAINQSSNRMKKGPTSILTQTRGYLNISLTGTLDDPKISVEKFPVKIIEETIGGTTETLKEVIGSIVDEIF